MGGDRLKPKLTGWEIFFTLLFLCIAVSMIIPFIYMVMMTFKEPIEIMKNPTAIFPKSFRYLENYKYIMGPEYDIWTLYGNSLKITGINVAASLLTSATAGYGFARLQFAGRDKIFLLYLATLIVPPQVTIIPRFLIFNQMGLIDNHLSLILPGLFSVIGTFLLRQYFMQLPSELAEAAKVDGANEYRIFWQMYLPLAMPALMSVLILNFSWHWNDYQSALIFLRSSAKYTLPLGMNVFADLNADRIYYIATAGTMSILPVILIFIIAQKYFITGLVAGSVKG